MYGKKRTLWPGPRDNNSVIVKSVSFANSKQEEGRAQSGDPRLGQQTSRSIRGWILTEERGLEKTQGDGTLLWDLNSNEVDLNSLLRSLSELFVIHHLSAFLATIYSALQIGDKLRVQRSGCAVREVTLGQQGESPRLSMCLRAEHRRGSGEK